jgi:hypothetical protein
MRGMKNIRVYSIGMAAVLAAFIVNVEAQEQLSSHVLSFGARHHQEHSTYGELPFGDGDVSYALAYEYHENAAYWQLALDASFDPSGTNTVTSEFDYVLTPQINLIFKDELWRGGAGALASYMVDKKTDDGEWTDIYWQFLLGLAIPLGGMELEVLAAYPFESFGDLSDFEGSDIDIVGWLKFSF